MKYDIIVGSDPAELAAKVNELHVQGWLAQGGAFSWEEHMRDHGGAEWTNVWFGQAMVKM